MSKDLAYDVMKVPEKCGEVTESAESAESAHSYIFEKSKQSHFSF